jgi:hypothetical protein
VRFLAIPVALFLAGLAITSVTSACSISVRPDSVGLSFGVKVSGYDGPVKGLLLNLTSPQGRVRSAITNGNGIADFNNAPPGTQYLRADHDNGYAERLQLDVKPNGPANIIVPMRWPAIEPIHVRSVSGTMRAPDAVPSQLEQRILSLDLLEGISGEILSSVTTTSRGAFDFGKLSPSLYFIHLKPYSAFFGRVEGLIGIAVDQAAPAHADKLDLNLTWSSCGPAVYRSLPMYPTRPARNDARRPRDRFHGTPAAPSGNSSARRNTEPGGACEHRFQRQFLVPRVPGGHVRVTDRRGRDHPGTCPSRYQPQRSQFIP